MPSTRRIPKGPLVGDSRTSHAAETLDTGPRYGPGLRVCECETLQHETVQGEMRNTLQKCGKILQRFVNAPSEGDAYRVQWTAVGCT